jgi:uncharacterized membrane protein HdeD (DUF308 family)
MSVQTENEVENDFLAGVGRAWWLLLLGGVISIAVGAMALVWPGKTIVVVAILFAIYLIISGIFEIVRSFAHGLTGGTRVLLLITGVLSVILGIFAIRSAINAAELLAIFIGIAFLFRGFGSLFLGFDSKDGRGWNIFFGIIMLIGGVVILVQPLISLATLAWVVGIWLVVIGIYEIIMAFVVRNRLKALI